MSIPGLDSLLYRRPVLKHCGDSLSDAFRLCVTCFANRGRLMVCGNGGSASDAEHVVAELMKGFLRKRPIPEQIRKKLIGEYGDHGLYLSEHLQGVLPALSLTGSPGLSTAFSNDVAADMIFAQQVYGHGAAGDVLLAISTSGRSRNVVNALQIARIEEISSIGLTGGDGGEMPSLCTVTIVVPERETPRIQELHLPIYHWLCEALEATFF